MRWQTQPYQRHAGFLSSSVLTSMPGRSSMFHRVSSGGYPAWNLEGLHPSAVSAVYSRGRRRRSMWTVRSPNAAHRIPCRISAGRQKKSDWRCSSPVHASRSASWRDGRGGRGRLFVFFAPAQQSAENAAHWGRGLGGEEEQMELSCRIVCDAEGWFLCRGVPPEDHTKYWIQVPVPWCLPQGYARVSHCVRDDRVGARAPRRITR